jgi:hypothetical protein
MQASVSPAFKKSLKVTPVVMRNLSKHHVVGNASLISHDHWRGFPFPELDKGKQEQPNREKAQVNRSRERLCSAPIQLIQVDGRQSRQPSPALLSDGATFPQSGKGRFAVRFRRKNCFIYLDPCPDVQVR